MTPNPGNRASGLLRTAGDRLARQDRREGNSAGTDRGLARVGLEQTYDYVHRAGFEDPRYQRLLLNGIRWTMRRFP